MTKTYYAELAEDELTGLKADQKLPLEPGEVLPTMVYVAPNHPRTTNLSN